MGANFLRFNSTVLSMVGDVSVDSEVPMTLSISRICQISLRRQWRSAVEANRAMPPPLAQKKQ